VRLDVVGDSDPSAAYHSGSICAVAAQGQRDLQGRAAAYDDLFPKRPFDSGVFSMVALANSFSAPWLSADRLRVVNRASLWAFRVDWLFDYLGESRAELEDVTARCMSVADGSTAADGDSLTRFLVDIRDDLASVPAFDVLHGIWREELRRMLAAMLREWDWRMGDGLGDITVNQYLDNADNHGSSFVNVSHWIFNAEPPAVAHVSDVLAATRVQQRVMRLVNDLGTHGRDSRWGDVNVLALGVTRADVNELLRSVIDGCHATLSTLRPAEPQMATFLERQVGFCQGFYRTSDYWGEL
jgi:Terpene synthase family 2, C-terminal metal binding